MRAQIEPDFESARKKYDEILEQILAYTDYCDEFGDEDGEEYRKVEQRLAKISGKDMSKFSLHEWWEAEGVMRELSANEIVEILWGKRG